MKTSTILLSRFALVTILAFAGAGLHAQNTAFTYQGRLYDGTNPANGIYDVQFSLFGTPTGGTTIAGPSTKLRVAVSEGLFTVALNFGAAVFTGEERWLEISVRTNGATGFVALSPRQPIAVIPYAIQAANASNLLGILAVEQGGTGAGAPRDALANLDGASLTESNLFNGVNTMLNPANRFAGSFRGNGTFLLGLDADHLSAGRVPNAQLAGSYSSILMFDNVSNTFRGSFSGNGAGLTHLNAGNLDSGVAPVVRGGTGAGTPTAARLNLGAAASGANTDITSLEALITPLSIAQGGTAAAAAPEALLNLGGASLLASNQFLGANTMLNASNRFSGSFTGDGSGLSNLHAGNLTAGTLPTAQLAGTYSSALILNNTANSFLGTFTGNGNNVSNVNAAALNGLVSSDFWQLGGNAGTVPGANFLGTSDAQPLELKVNGTRGLRLEPTATGVPNIIAGSSINSAGPGTFGATVSGGHGNTSSGAFSTVPGGSNNLAAGDYSFAAGRRARANHNGDFVWADSNDTDFNSTAPNQFLIRAAAGVAINTNDPAGRALSVNGPVGVSGSNTLEFGAYLAGKHSNAGKIGYQTFTPGALDIVGAGTNAISRRIKFWAEAGATFNGTGTNPLVVVANTVDEPASLSFTAPFSTWRIGQNKPPDAPGAFDSFFIYQQSVATTRLLITDSGRVGLGTNSPTHPLHLANGAYCTAAGVWTSVCDRNAKENFTPVHGREILAKVAALPITEWKYKVETNGVRHLGPTAQDFHAAFGLGQSDKTIGAVDADGVTLAAIQGLNALLNEQREEIRALRAHNREMERRLKLLEGLISLPPQP